MEEDLLKRIKLLKDEASNLASYAGPPLKCSPPTSRPIPRLLTPFLSTTPSLFLSAGHRDAGSRSVLVYRG